MVQLSKGRKVLMDALIAEGVKLVFGNPGTTELPLLESLLDTPRLRYILALHESVAVIMAEAYAQASGRVGVVNLHVGPGLGNGLGAIYNAWEGKTPLVVTAGQQDTRMRLREPLLGHDLVAMAAPLVKWSVEARSADELPLVLHRAFKTAREAPSGPVFVSLPMNVMEQETAQGALPAARLFARGAAAPEGIREAAQALLKARRPLIFCGNGLGRAGALAELVALAELTGAPVYDEVLPSRVNFPHSHAHYRDQGYGDQAQLRKLCGDADVILLVAGEFFEEVWFKEDSPFPEDAVLIQIEDAESNLARNYPVQCGLLGDPARTLQAIQAELLQHAPAGFHAAAETRRGVLREQKAQDLTRHQQRLTSGWDRLPMSTARLMHELRQALPPEVTISNEVITANPDLLRTLSLDTPRDMIASRGGGIGQALPSAIGIKLAWPERPVVALSGDGSSLYTLQCLWTAAHHKIPVVFCILNNGGYRILKLNMNRYRQDSGIGGERPYPHMDLTEPSPDYVSLARGYGVPGQRVDSPDAVGPALRQALDSGGPYLLEFVVDGRV